MSIISYFLSDPNYGTVVFYSVVILAICTILGSLHAYLDKKVIYKDLRNKHVVVTGGSSGIGKSAAGEAARLGANVTIIGRDVGKLKNAVEEISAKSLDKRNQKIRYSALDVTSDYKIIEKCFSSLEEEVGPIFMLINCAGACICGQFSEMSVTDIKGMVDLNYFGTAYPTRCVLPKMKERNEGIIVFVSSEAALLGIYGYSAYSGGKWAVRGLAEAISMELVGSKVRLMISFPPDTDTPGLQQEDLTKPVITKLISRAAGLYSPETVGRQMVHDALNGKCYSVYSPSGRMLITLCGSLIEGAIQIFAQILLLPLLRIIQFFALLHFYDMIRDGQKQAKANKTN